MSLFLTPGSFFGVQAWQVQVLHACRVQPSKKVQLDAFSEFLGDALTFFYLLTLFPKLPFSDDWIFSPTAHIGGQSLIGTAFFCCWLFFFLAAPRGIWDLSYPTGDQTHAPCTGITGIAIGLPGKSQALHFWIAIAQSLHFPRLILIFTYTQERLWQDLLNNSLSTEGIVLFLQTLSVGSDTESLWTLMLDHLFYDSSSKEWLSLTWRVEKLTAPWARLVNSFTAWC